jgi:hypothetical protein
MRATAPRLGLLASSAAWALATAPAGAAPTACPFDSGIATCEIAVGDTSVRIDAGDGVLVVYDWRVADVEHLYEERFPILDVLSFPQQGFHLELESATADAASASVETRFVESAAVFRATATFTLADTADGAQLDESLVLDSFSVTRATRLHVVTDFDLAGAASDEAILASDGGVLVTQQDGDVTATVSVSGGDPPPDAFQVAHSSTLADLALGNAFFPLDGTASIPGPDDFAAALSWNRTLGPGQAFAVALHKRVAVPEPTAAIAGSLALVALVRCRRHAGSAAARCVR